MSYMISFDRVGRNRNVPNLGPRLTIVDASGKRLARIGGMHAGLGRGEFIAPHGIAVDSRGDVYVGEVSFTSWPELFPKDPMPPGLRCLQKFRRVAGATAAGGKQGAVIRRCRDRRGSPRLDRNHRRRRTGSRGPRRWSWLRP